jgi:CspA family cold shock protein
MTERGTIAFWNADRAFGFINPKSGGPQVFVHLSGFAEYVINDEIRKDMQVTYFLSPPADDHKIKAVNVKITALSPDAEVKTERLERQG